MPYATARIQGAGDPVAEPPPENPPPAPPSCVPAPLDSFNRTNASALGAGTPTGYSWRSAVTNDTGGADSVDGSVGRIKTGTGSSPWRTRYRRMDGRQGDTYPYEYHVRFKVDEASGGKVIGFPLTLDTPGDLYGWDFAIRQSGTAGVCNIEMETYHSAGGFEYQELWFGTDGMSDAGGGTKFAINVGTWYEARMSFDGTTFLGRVWLSGSAEPTGYASLLSVGGDYRSTGDYTSSGGGVGISCINSGLSGGVVVGEADVYVDYIDACPNPGSVFDDFGNRTTTTGWGEPSSQPGYNWQIIGDSGSSPAVEVSGGIGILRSATFVSHAYIDSQPGPWNAPSQTTLMVKLNNWSSDPSLSPFTEQIGIAVCTYYELALFGTTIKVIGWNGTYTQAWSPTNNVWYKVKFDICRETPGHFKVKIWDASTAEPGSWTADFNDGVGQLFNNYFELLAYKGNAVNVIANYDDLNITN